MPEIITVEARSTEVADGGEAVAADGVADSGLSDASSDGGADSDEGETLAPLQPLATTEPDAPTPPAQPPAQPPSQPQAPPGGPTVGSPLPGVTAVWHATPDEVGAPLRHAVGDGTRERSPSTIEAEEAAARLRADAAARAARAEARRSSARRSHAETAETDEEALDRAAVAREVAAAVATPGVGASAATPHGLARSRLSEDEEELRT